MLGICYGLQILFDFEFNIYVILPFYAYIAPKLLVFIIWYIGSNQQREKKVDKHL